MGRFFGSLFLLLALAACGGSASGGGLPHAAQLCYAPCIVELAGILTTIEKFGPPNFGETPEVDTHYKVYIIHLDPPIDIVQSSPTSQEGDAISDVQQVQLELSPLPQQIKDLVSKRVIARGQLRQAILPTHFEPVVLTVDSLRAAE